MALQLPAQYNVLDWNATERHNQNKDWNALRMEGEQQRQGMVGREYDEQTRVANTKWLAGAAQHLAGQGPQSARSQFPKMIEEGRRRGLWTEFEDDWQTQSDEELMSELGEMYDSAMLGLQGIEQPAPELVEDAAGYQRHASGSQFGERAFPDVVATPGANGTIPAKIQQAEWWLNATPDQRAGYMSANYAGSVKDIAGVPHWVMPGGDSVPLSDLQSETDAASQVAMAEGEGTRGRRMGEGGEFEAVPGTEAARDEEAERRKRGGGAFMKSIQAQTVVEDVFRLNDQLDAGTVPFGRNAKAQADMHPSLQSDGYRNAVSIIESVKGNVGIDSLLRIKATGAGLGQVPQSQLDLLSRLLGELDLGQSEEQFTYTWNRMRRVYEAIMIQAEDELIKLGYQVPQVMDEALRPRVGKYGDEATPTGQTATNKETGQKVQEMSDGSWVIIDE